MRIRFALFPARIKTTCAPMASFALGAGEGRPKALPKKIQKLEEAVVNRIAAGEVWHSTPVALFPGILARVSRPCRQLISHNGQ